MGNTKSLGVAYSDQDITGANSCLADGNNGKLGGPANFQSVTQITSFSTPVVQNAVGGNIVTVALSGVSPGGIRAIPLTNSAITANSNIVVTKVNNGIIGTLLIIPSAILNGSATFKVTNMGAGTFNGAVSFNYLILTNQ